MSATGSAPATDLPELRDFIRRRRAALAGFMEQGAALALDGDLLRVIPRDPVYLRYLNDNRASIGELASELYGREIRAQIEANQIEAKAAEDADGLDGRDDVDPDARDRSDRADAEPARGNGRNGGERSAMLPAHREYLSTRAVADEVAAERGYRSATKRSELERLGFGRTQQLVPSLVIPICSVRGEVESYQLRPDNPRMNKKGKARKYEMRSGSRMLLDVHPRLGRPYGDGEVALIAGPAIPLFITEGIPKADAGISIGLCCIALLGVWNFRGSNAAGGKTALADWESVALNGRSVYIAFDSDVMEKPEVYDALARLKPFLESRKANVKLIYLPNRENGQKLGLDDYIAREKATGRSDAEIRDALLALATSELRRPPSEATDRPEIIIEAGQQPRIIDDAEKTLVANAPRLRIFQRGGEIVRVVALDREIERAGLRRPTGTVQLAPVSMLNLLENFERLIAWLRPGGEDGPKPADCPAKIAATYLARIGDWRLPLLTGIIEAPIMRRDGSILSARGYDKATELFLHSEEDWPDIPDVPTRAEAEAAVRELREPFAEFPFVDEAARSVLIAGILTAIQRRLLESAPLFAFDAPAQRSGKSLLAESLGLIVTGRKPAASGIAKEGDELRKAITSALRENQAIINLDNITRPLDSPDLARAITQSEYADRLLGTNRMLRLPTNVLWTATGNNLAFRGDLPSRALLCRIDPETERPEERVFKIDDLPAHLLANRKRHVTAALTIVRAYRVAGSPRQMLRPWGGFDHWSREIREPLVWLGLPDPCATRERIIVSDPDRELTTEVLRTWQAAFGDRAMLVREIVAAAQDGEHDELKQALLMVAAKRDDSNQIDARRLGAWCSSKAARVIDGLRLTPDRKIQRAQGWRVSRVSSVSSKPADPNGPTHTESSPQNGQASESVYASPPF